MSNRVCIKRGLLTLMGVKFMGRLEHPTSFSMFVRSKTTSAQYVASRFRDPTFEKLMDNYKNLVKVIFIQDLILANPKNPSVSIDFLSKLSQKLHLNRGATAFLCKFPHIFHIYYDHSKLKPFCRLTDAALGVTRQEAVAINASLPVVVERLVRILSMSASRMVPLRAVFKVWKELGLPDDFEDSVISANSGVFQLCDGHEQNTHLLKLVDGVSSNGIRAAVEDWRVVECCKEDCSVDRMEMQFSFKHGYPPGMRLSKNFKAKVKEWQRLPYVGPYEMPGEKKKSKAGMMAMEKRAVSIVHEFLSLTVEKMVEVEKISQFRKWFGIDLNIRDLFLDHPGIFYLSTKGKKHTVFLREAYERGCLIEPNPVYDARRRLLDLVALGRRGLPAVNSKLEDSSSCGEARQEENQQRHYLSPS
ncbi:protein ROOT PRIMORDIUM DEFECTIVE 1-like [Vigna umbellata]|uniref:protein ROOT PRIMORDIUM DEFECTIVE 1-like n=1 Tax=Vigna umbellata TaxID=87088 RepID=UPI001F5E7B5B|nr:protein ROOT PRIMORDIUM DEFECTIVE 1-like [Vigna umbellata]XP_047172505.1 protein ROOT PRIMORDIUM DEFECTIVE 1-like [Vigna umbellata]